MTDVTDPPAGTTGLPLTPGTGVFRVLHTSDWQLGMDRWFLGDEAGPRYREARLAAVERVLEIARHRGCAAVVVAGDVFDDNLVDPVTWRRAVDILQGSDIPVYLLPGNHDPYDAASVYRTRDFDGLAPTVTVLTDSEPRDVPGTGEDGVPAAQVVGAPLLSKYMSTDPVAAALAGLRAEPAGLPAQSGPSASSRPLRVLVGHGATQSRVSGDDPAVIDVDAAAAACRDGVVDLVALGDTHSVTRLHPEGTVWYSGSPEVTDFREQDGGGENRSGYALIADISSAGVEVEEVRTGTWNFLALHAQINDRQDVDDWIARLDALPDKRTTVVKYALTGTVDLSTGAYLDERTDRAAPGFAALYQRTRLMDLHVLPGDTELADADWPGVVGTAARELVDRAGGGEETARDALRLLYRLSGHSGK